MFTHLMGREQINMSYEYLHFSSIIKYGIKILLLFQWWWWLGGRDWEKEDRACNNTVSVCVFCLPCRHLWNWLGLLLHRRRSCRSNVDMHLAGLFLWQETKTISLLKPEQNRTKQTSGEGWGWGWGRGKQFVCFSWEDALTLYGSQINANESVKLELMCDTVNRKEVLWVLRTSDWECQGD